MKLLTVVYIRFIIIEQHFIPMAAILAEIRELIFFLP